MNFPNPSKRKFTIYTKSGCIYCNKVKELLNKNYILFDIIDCDEFIIENKSNFLAFLQNIIGHEYKTFPMVFDDEGLFIGGYTDTVKYVEKMLDFEIF
jgi:glutaredoxin